MAVRSEPQRNWMKVVVGGEGGEPVLLDPPTLAALHDVLDRLPDAADVRCVVIEIADCLGAPLHELGGADESSLRHGAAEFVRLLQRLHDAPAPVVLCAGGRMLGGATGVAAACDVVLCRPDVSFSLPEAGMGMAPVLIEPWLTRRIGAARFRALALSGMEVDAAGACRIGLADGVFDGEGFPPCCARILRSAPAAVAEIKRLSRTEAGAGALEAFMAYVSAPGVRADVLQIAEGGSPAWRRKSPPAP